MVVTNITQIKTDLFTLMDGFDYIGIGTDNTTPGISDTSLGAEVDRNILTGTTQNLAAGTYLFGTKFTLAEANGNTIKEFGIFNASSGGDMGLRNLVTPNITKTADVEIIINSQINLNIINT